MRILQDLRYALRLLLRQPGFTLAAVITLAVGLGATTAIFSVINALLLRSLPYPESDRLVQMWMENRNYGDGAIPMSVLDLRDWQRDSTLLEEVSGYFTTGYNLWGDTPERIDTGVASYQYFRALGVNPLAGRLFEPEDEAWGNHRVSVISYGLWHRRYGGRLDAIGQTLTIDGFAYKIIGILPPDFTHPVPGTNEKPDMWRAFGFRADTLFRDDRQVRAIARLKEGVTPAQAQAEMEEIARQVERQYPDTNKNLSVRLVPLQEQVVGNVRQTLMVLLGAVGFVLLIACANVANLLLSRSAARQRELAIRAALGAGRGRIIQQLLTESLLLALMGGALGIAMGAGGVRLLAALGPGLPAHNEIRIDLRVLSFTLGISLLAGLLAGVAPALLTSGSSLPAFLKEAGRGAIGSLRRKYVHNLLIISEIAFSLVLLVGAGLLIKSFVQLVRVEPGFNIKNILTMQTAFIWLKHQETEKKTLFLDQVLERVKALPGVHGAAVAQWLPLKETIRSGGFYIEGQPPPDAGTAPQAQRQMVSPDYFEIMDIRLLKGRLFAPSDRLDTTRVAIINKTMAERFWPGESPIGRRVRIESPGSSKWLEIIGVVSDVRHARLDAEPEPEIYAPVSQGEFWDTTFWTVNLVVRSEVDQATLTPMIRREVLAVDKDQPVYGIKTLEDALSDSLAPRRFSLWLFTGFGLVALFLAAIGVYGVMSQTVAQRTKEIGIRVALGAQPGDVLGLVMRQGLFMIVAGIAVGVLLAWGLTHLMASLLFKVDATDPVTFAAIALLLMAIAALASFLPARRATRVNPVITLRADG